MCFDWSALDLQQKVHLGSSGSQSPDLGDAWRTGCPRSPDWDTDAYSWTESEGASSELREHDVESRALRVVGQNWSGE